MNKKKTEGGDQVRTVTLDWETHCRLKRVCEDSGLKAVDIYRLAIKRLLREVEETGMLTFAARGDEEGGEV